MAFGLLWLILPFLPTSNVLIWVGTMLAERLLYLPSIGFCCLCAVAAHSAVRTRLCSQRGALIACLLVCSVFGALTIDRNRAWVDERILFDSAEKVCPDSAKVHFNQAIMAMDRKDFSKARFHLRRTREIEPNYCEVDLQIGILAWEEAKDPNRAVTSFKLALNCVYTKVKAVENLHAIYQALTSAFHPFLAAFCSPEGFRIVSGKLFLLGAMGRHPQLS